MILTTVAALCLGFPPMCAFRHFLAEWRRGVLPFCLRTERMRRKHHQPVRNRPQMHLQRYL